MGEFDDEAVTAPVDIGDEPTELAAIATVTVKVRATTLSDWPPEPPSPAPVARRHKKFYAAITASKLPPGIM